MMRIKKYAIVTLVERGAAQLVGQACVNLIELYESIVKTLAFDNGPEFARHDYIHSTLGSTFTLQTITHYDSVVQMKVPMD